MSASPATALLVLGMHRSGTSALTAVLNDLGASLGNELVAANDDNPGGYFENAGAVTAHEMLLAELDRGWEDLRELPEGCCSPRRASGLKQGSLRCCAKSLRASRFGR